MPGTPCSLDLSEATKLKEVEFRSHTPSVRWISTALRTSKSENLRNIVVYFFSFISNPVGEQVRLGLQDLDNLLVQLWITHSICPVFFYRNHWTKGLVPQLLPGLASRGVVMTQRNDLIYM